MCLGLIAALPLAAQIKSSTITGQVTDPSGASIAAATLTVRNQATNFAVTSRSNGAGEFTVPYLEVGRYTVTVEDVGYAPFKEIDINPESSQILRLPVSMKLGSVSSQVTVTASTAQLRTETAAVSGAVETKAISAIPNLNVNPLYFATLQPGVVGTAVMQQTQIHDSFGVGYNSHQFFSELSVNGGEAEGNDILLDGVPIVGAGLNDANVIPNLAGLQEVRVFTSLTNSEYGRRDNVFNHTEFTAFQLGLSVGDPNLTDHPGATTAASDFGTGSHGLGTFDPRQLQLAARFT